MIVLKIMTLSTFSICFSTENIHQSFNLKDDYNPILHSDYKQDRKKILDQEYFQSLGGNVQLTGDEIKANKIIMALKNKEVGESFRNPREFNLSKHYFAYKNDLKKSKVYQIIKKMPKGAALHLHSTYAMDGDYLLNLTYEDHLYACYNKSYLDLIFSDKIPVGKCSEKWTLMKDLREASDSVTAFDAKIKSFFTLVSDDYKNDDINSIWDKFSKQKAALSFLTYRPTRERIIYDMLQKFYDDNVMYVEIRTGSFSLLELNGTEHDVLYFIGLHKKVTDRFVKDHSDFVGIKIIYTTSRFGTIEKVREHLETALKIKEKYPDLFAGFDLVSREDTGHPLLYYIPLLLEYKDKLNYYFHAGETNWFGTPSDENLIDAILLGTHRIGHGFALNKHPALFPIIKSKNIAIEVNIISNIVLALVTDARLHPLASFLAENLPVVLSSDDPGVWSAEPMTDDFYLAFMVVASQHADLKMLKQLVFNSIQYSALDDSGKRKLSNVVDKRWRVFIQEVIGYYRCKLEIDIDIVYS